jgi:hypothetical protein
MTGFSLFADPGCPPGHAVFLFWNFRRNRRMARSERQPMTFGKPAATAVGAQPVTRLLLAGLLLGDAAE